MTKKDFLMPLGERVVNQENPDELLKSKISERKRKEIERQEEIDEAKHSAQLAEYRKKAKTSDAEVEKVEKKESEGPAKFEIKGGINLGEIDYQAMLRESQGERDKLRQEAEEQARTQAGINDTLREKLHAKEIEVLQVGFQAQMNVLQKMIEGNSSKGSFTEQLESARVIAKELGYQLGAPGGGSEMIQLELKKLDFEHSKGMRELARADKAEDRKWQLELRRLDDERDFKRQELDQQRRKDSLIASLPQQLGGAIAKGLMETGSETGSASPSSTPGKGHIEANWGESGEAECECGGVLGIGSTARAAVCPDCGSKFAIKRVGEKPRARVEEEE